MDGLRCDGCGAFAEHATTAALGYRRVTQSPLLAPVPPVEHYCLCCWEIMRGALPDPDARDAAAGWPLLAEWLRARRAGRLP